MEHPRNVSRKARGDDLALTFPQKLMELLEDRSHEDVVAWLDNGKAFRVFDKNAFTQHVLPRFFRHRPSKFLSFVRKLNRWGFTRVQSHAAVDRNYAERPVYTHPLFQRGQHNLLSQINCSVVGAAATGQQITAAKIMSDSSSATKRPTSKSTTPPPAPSSLLGDASDLKEKEGNCKSRTTTRSPFVRSRLLSCPAPVRSCQEEESEEESDPPQESALLGQSAKFLLSPPPSSAVKKRPIDKTGGGSTTSSSMNTKNQQLLPIRDHRQQSAHSSKQEELGKPCCMQRQAQQKQVKELSLLSACSSSLAAAAAAESQEPSLLALLFGQLCARQEALQRAEDELLVRHFATRALLAADTAAIAQSLASHTARARKKAASSLLVGGAGAGGAPTSSIVPSLLSSAVAPTTISTLFSDNNHSLPSLLASPCSTTRSSASCSLSIEQTARGSLSPALPSSLFAPRLPLDVVNQQQHCGGHNKNNDNILRLLSLLHHEQN